MGRILRDVYIVAGMLLGILLCFLLMIALNAAYAHDHEHPELSDWYMSLQSKEGHPCCDGPGKDASHLDDIDWETKDGHYRVRIEGAWYDVPDEAVIEGPNKDGRAIVWGYPITDYGQDGARHTSDYHVRCFIPGAGT